MKKPIAVFLLLTMFLLSSCAAFPAAKPTLPASAGTNEASNASPDPLVPTPSQRGDSKDGSSSSSPASPDPAGETTESTDSMTETKTSSRAVSVYLGVKDYGTGQNKDDLLFRFFEDGRENAYPIDPALDSEGKATYALHNLLSEGGFYHLTVENGSIAALDRADLSDGRCGIAEEQPDGTLLLSGVPYTENGELPLFRILPQAGGAAIEPSALKDGDCLFLPEDGACGYVFEPQPVYQPPVNAVPGERTLKNLLLTAFSPVGSALYVYGGGWDWQDEGSAPSTRTIGLYPSWIAFYSAQGADYLYKAEDRTKSYYPYDGYNEYYDRGLDCSGYLGWVLYNVFNTESGSEGWVGGSTRFAKRLADAGLGVFSKDVSVPSLRPGDIVSIKGHVFMILGTCSDGSAVILHSSVADSVTSARGGGVQLSAIGTSADCEAYALADRYLSEYFPSWYDRYGARLCDPALYFDVSAETAGVLHWNADPSGLSDPDGLLSLDASAILALLFEEKTV